MKLNLKKFKNKTARWPKPRGRKPYKIGYHKANMEKLLTAINAFMDDPAINAARHSSEAANALAEQVEREMTALGLYSETGEFLTSAAALLGKRGGSATSEAKAIAARANGKRGGRPRKAK